jgi:hypothetical protein
MSVTERPLREMVTDTGSVIGARKLSIVGSHQENNDQPRAMAQANSAQHDLQQILPLYIICTNSGEHSSRIERNSEETKENEDIEEVRSAATSNFVASRKPVYRR